MAPPTMVELPLDVPPPLREFSLEQLQAALVGQLFVGIVYVRALPLLSRRPRPRAAQLTLFPAQATHVLSTIQYYRKFGGRDGDKKSVQVYVGCALFLGTLFAAINTAVRSLPLPPHPLAGASLERQADAAFRAQVSWRWLTHAITFGYTDLVVRNSDVVWTWTLGTVRRLSLSLSRTLPSSRADNDCIDSSRQRPRRTGSGASTECARALSSSTSSRSLTRSRARRSRGRSSCASSPSRSWPCRARRSSPCRASSRASASASSSRSSMCVLEPLALLP